MVAVNYFEKKAIGFPFVDGIQSILNASLEAVNPSSIIKNSLQLKEGILKVRKKNYPLSSYERIILIGLGKASQAMVNGAKQILSGSKLTGLVIAKNNDLKIGRLFLPDIKTILGNHPIPGEKSILAAEELINFTKNRTEKDLVLCLISGGGSALVTKPADGILLEDIQKLTTQLLKCGANISEINTIRKHLDELKGGGLARMLSPAHIITLILSDVVGDNLSMIASGPTTVDETTFRDAYNILNKYELLNISNKRIIAHLQAGLEGKKEETLKKNDPIIKKIQTEIIGNNHVAALAAKKKAEEEGFNCRILTDQMVGNTSEVGIELGQIIKDIRNRNAQSNQPICLIAGGESTVKIKGNGLGGRNQEVALFCAIEIDGLENVCVATLATDGEDGPTDAAGAIITGHTISSARLKGLDPNLYLDNNDSYHFFKKNGGMIRTGVTGTNVNDLNFIFMT
jgi:glycerate 2-kinase